MSVAALTPISSNGTASASTIGQGSRRPDSKSPSNEAQAAAAASSIPMTQQLQQTGAATSASAQFSTSLSSVAASAPSPALGANLDPAMSIDTTTSGDASSPTTSGPSLADAAQSLFGDALSGYVGAHTLGLL